MHLLWNSHVARAYFSLNVKLWWAKCFWFCMIPQAQFFSCTSIVWLIVETEKRVWFHCYIKIHAKLLDFYTLEHRLSRCVRRSARKTCPDALLQLCRLVYFELVGFARGSPCCSFIRLSASQVGWSVLTVLFQTTLLFLLLLFLTPLLYLLLLFLLFLLPPPVLLVKHAESGQLFKDPSKHLLLLLRCLLFVHKRRWEGVKISWDCLFAFSSSFCKN